MSFPIIFPAFSAVTAASTAADGNIPIDGTYTGTVDGIALAANQVFYLSHNTAVGERAYFSTGADHTQPWTKLPNTQISLLTQSVFMQPLSGTTQGGKPYLISDLANGTMVELNTSSADVVFGTGANGGYTNARGIFKYVTSSSLTIPTGSSQSVVFTFVTGGGAVPFTDATKMHIDGCVPSSATSNYLVATTTAIDTATVTVNVVNNGASAVDVIVRLNVSQFS